MVIRYVKCSKVVDIAAKGIIVVSLFSMTLPAQVLHAQDLNGEVNTMFSSLGAIGNYTAPGAFRGQAYNTFTGGNLYLRSPNKVYQLTAIQWPNAKGGCGGIDGFGGSFSHISATEFKNMLKNITAALPGVAFQLALESVTPLLGGLTKWAKDIETKITNARINSCETAMGLVSSAAEATGFSSGEACSKLAVSMGLESDAASARERCRTDRPSILATARGSTKPGIKEQAPFIGNLTWKALQYVNNIDDKKREIIMSMVGTAIFYPDEVNSDTTVKPAILTSIKQLLYGQSAASGGNVNIHIYSCNNYTDCDVVSDNPSYVHTPFTVKVENLMRSISDKIKTRTAIPNPSAEFGFINQTTEPVYKMLSIGNTTPWTGIADSLIGTYREVIATDYAYNFLERDLRMGMAALEKNYHLNKRQLEVARDIRLRAGETLALLSQEKMLAYKKVGNITSVTANLAQLERQLRTSMPQSVQDMLGQQSGVLGK